MIDQTTSFDSDGKSTQLIIKQSVEVICGKWRLAVLDLLRRETLRYGEIKRLIPGISEKVLVQELKHLVDLGLLTKKSYQEAPPRVEYSLTEKGHKVIPVIDLLLVVGPQIM